MGYTTDFVGHIDITPPLNEQEAAYLAAFGASRRFEREGGPYAVPGNPYAEERGDVAADRYNTPPPGQPGLWCRWVPCWEGCCLALDGGEKIYDPTRWLRYLIDHFLKPGAVAATSGHPQLDALTFDHRLDGMVVGCRRDNKELYAIEVRDNVVTERVLREADPRYLDWPPLPYEEQNDRDRAAARRRRTKRSGTARSGTARSGTARPNNVIGLFGGEGDVI